MGEHAALIAPLTSGGRADELAVRLTEAIQLGLVTNGDRLPPEHEFAQQLGVSPMTLREAIATLRERGLVETRRGRSGGTFVTRSFEPDEAPDRARLADLPVSALRDIADEQLAITVSSARLAAERASDASVRKLLTLVDRIGTCTTRGARMRADSRFHIEVAIATRSERLTRCEVTLQAETVGLLWLSELDDADVTDIAREHHDIAWAIADEDPARAQAAAEHHVRQNLRRVAALHLELVDSEESPS